MISRINCLKIDGQCGPSPSQKSTRTSILSKILGTSVLLLSAGTHCCPRLSAILLLPFAPSLYSIAVEHPQPKRSRDHTHCDPFPVADWLNRSRYGFFCNPALHLCFGGPASPWTAGSTHPPCNAQHDQATSAHSCQVWSYRHAGHWKEGTAGSAAQLLPRSGETEAGQCRQGTHREMQSCQPELQQKKAAV